MYFKSLQDLTSVSIFIDKIIQTNLAFANTIWKHSIKNLDNLFQMFSQRVKHHRNTPPIFQPAKFLLSFYNDTRCNKINQMAALRMDLYSLISLHKYWCVFQILTCTWKLSHRCYMKMSAQISFNFYRVSDIVISVLHVLNIRKYHHLS